MVSKLARELNKGKQASVTIKVDRLGRLFIRMPLELAFKKLASFKVKFIGHQAILLERPVRGRDVMKLNVERWKSIRQGCRKQVQQLAK